MNKYITTNEGITLIQDQLEYKNLVEDLLSTFDDREMTKLPTAIKHLIAAIISKLNHCNKCFDYHLIEVQKYGIDYDIAAQIKIDYKSSNIDQRTKDLLGFCEAIAMQLDEKQISSMVDGLKESHWSFKQIFEAVILINQICTLNNHVLSSNIEAPQNLTEFQRAPLQRSLK